MEPLTDRQEEIFRFILDFLHDRGRPPTIREIGAKLGISSTNGVRDHLLALRRKGYLVETPKGQGIEVVSEFRQTLRDIPIVGRVPAGPQQLAIEHLEGTLIEELVGGKNEDTFALRVRGDSMIEAGIYDGDFVIVSTAKHVERGEIGLAYIDGEATIKRIFQENGHFRLQPENENMSPIIVDKEEDFRIAGKVIGVVRKI